MFSKLYTYFIQTDSWCGRGRIQPVKLGGRFQ